MDLPDLDTLDLSDLLNTPVAAPRYTDAEREEMREKHNRLCRERDALAKCPKCGGRGHIEDFRHISGGVCFACDGTGRKASKVAMKRADRLQAEIDNLRGELTA